MKKIFYVVCLITMFMFVGEVRADTVCKYTLPKGTIVDYSETKLELYNEDGSMKLNKIYASTSPSEGTNIRYNSLNFGNDIKAFEVKKNTSTGEFTCPAITLDLNSDGRDYIYNNYDECKKGTSWSKSSCKTEVYHGIYSSDEEITGGNSSGRTNAKLITKNTNSCMYRSYNFEVTVKTDNGISCRKGTSKEGVTCTAKINDTVYKDFINSGTFTCPEYIYYTYYGGQGVSDRYNLEVLSTAGANEEDTSNSEDFRDPDVLNNGSADDEWIEGPSDLGEFQVSACEVLSKESSLYKIMKQIIGYVQIGTIFIVILLSGLDFVGAISSGDDDAFKKAVGKTKNRIIALVLVFLVPAIVNILLTIVNVGACGSNTDFMTELFR